MDEDEWCSRLGAKLASVTRPLCERAALVPAGAASHQGFPILVRRVPATQPPADREPMRILLLGGIHGDELTSVSIVFQWLDLIDSPQAAQFHWHVAPVLNPDGLFSAKPQRMNARGVDLNRNFPTPGWKEDAKDYWVKRARRDPRRFPGEAPLSEPESRWLHEEIERFRPDVVISVHAPFGILDFDGPKNPPRRFGRLYLNRLGVYPGSLGNYGGMHKNMPVITIELPNATTMPPREEVERIWRDMLAWLERTAEGKASDEGKDEVVESEAPPEH
ncbi:MAG TPA: M14 family murein peptide amidase A [Noviherbaspirillum sp.]